MFSIQMGWFLLVFLPFYNQGKFSDFYLLNCKENIKVVWKTIVLKYLVDNGKAETVHLDEIDNLFQWIAFDKWKRNHGYKQ